MSIAALVRALKQLGSDLSDEQIAEALWMLQYLPSPTVTPAAAVPLVAHEEGGAEPVRVPPPRERGDSAPSQGGAPSPATEDRDGDQRSDQRTPEQRNAPDADATDEARAELKQRGGPSAGTGSSGATGVSIYVPGEVALRNSRAYARSLRALDRHERSRHRYALDEQETIRRLLEERVFLPVQRPERERWLALHLVLDYSRSMGIWHKLLAELRTIFVRLGVFKNVRIWAFDADNRAPTLRPLAQHGRVGVSDLRPSALVDPTGRTLVLVVSDAVSPAWHAGTMAEAFEQWGKVGPTALLQVLPQHLWPRSSLSQGWPVTLSGAARTPSARLRLQARGRMARVRRLPLGTRVPILALTPDSFRDWSQMVAGVPGASGAGYHLALPIEGEASTAALPARPRTHGDDTEALKDFLRVTSPTAIELAKLLAVAPILSLPIIRTVQSKLLPASGQAHLAEIFLGGILRPLVADDDPEEAIYTFVSGAREQLLSRAAHPDTRRAFKAVSSFIQEQARSSSRFRAFLDVPAGMGDSLADTVQAAFAQATAAVLRDLGYHDLARAMAEAQRRTQRPWFTRGYALVIGVGSWPQTEQRTGSITASEAQTVAAALTDPDGARYLPAHVRLLTNESATSSAIVAQLAWLAATTAEDDCVLLFYSGVWDRDPDGRRVLTTYDSAGASGAVRGGSISAEQFIELVRRIPAQEVLMIFSASYPAIDPEVVDRLVATGYGRMVLTDRDPDQFYAPKLVEPISLFATILAESFKNRALPNQGGYLSVFDLYDVVRTQMVENTLSKQEGYRVPLLVIRSDARPFPIAVHPEAAQLGIFAAPSRPKLYVRIVQALMAYDRFIEALTTLAAMIAALQASLSTMPGDVDQMAEDRDDLTVATLYIQQALAAANEQDGVRLRWKVSQIQRELTSPWSETLKRDELREQISRLTAL